MSGYLVMYLGVIINERGSDTELEYFFERMFFILGLIIWGCTGLVWMIRKEAPQAIPVKGRLAVILGISLFISTWSMAVYGIFLIFFSIFSK